MIRQLLIQFAILIFGAQFAFGQGQSLSSLPAASSVNGTDLFYDVQTAGVGGVKATAAQIATFINGLNNTWTNFNTFNLPSNQTGISINGTVPSPPSSIVAAVNITNVCLGNNSTFEGCSGGFFTSNDNASVVAGTKGVLYGLQLAVRPLIARNNSPNDDATGLVVQNNATGIFIATDAVFVGHNSVFTGGAAEWQTAFLDNANVNSAYAVATGVTVGYGVDLCWGGCATVNNAAFRAPNNVSALVARNAAASADILIAKVNASNQIILGPGSNAVTLDSLGIPYFNFNTSGTFPTQNSGTAIVSNLTNGSNETDIVNTNTASADIFRIYHQTGANAGTMEFDVTTTGVNIPTGNTYQINGLQIASTNLADVAKDTSWVPTFAAGSGTFTAISAPTAIYNNIGKNYFVLLTIHITTLGSAAGNMQFTLPSISNRDTVFNGYDANGGFQVICTVAAASNNVLCTKYDSTFGFTTSDFVRVSGWFESQ